MTATTARLSKDRKYVVCRACGQSLCRRDERQLPGGPAQIVEGRRVPGYERVWLLVWDDGWHRVGDHIEQSARVKERLADGWRPVRHDWADAERLQLSRFLKTYPPALCECGALNEVSSKRLKVNGIGSR